jgi:hypothetical protein
MGYTSHCQRFSSEALDLSQKILLQGGYIYDKDLILSEAIRRVYSELCHWLFSYS